jgi:hypothetical protein
MTLLAARPSMLAADAGAAFATPTVVYFSTVLLLSALLRAPWQDYSSVQWLCASLGVAGCRYVLIVVRRMLTQRVYTPEFEDWAFHALIPMAAYATLIAAALMASHEVRESLFAIAAAALLLLFTGIHNAWDATTYNVLVNKDSDPPSN